MPIELEWDVSDAPGDSPAQAAPPPVFEARPTEAPPPRPRRAGWRPTRRQVLVGLVLGVLGAVATGLGWFSYAQWLTFQQNIYTVVAYEEQAGLLGNSDLVARLQAPENADWVQARVWQAQNFLAASLPIPTLKLANNELHVVAITARNENLVQAQVERTYATTDGRAFVFALPQFYQRGTGSWQRAAPPGDWWGDIQDWQSPHLHLRYYAVDKPLVDLLAPLLEERLRQLCHRWKEEIRCATPVRLYFSASLTTLMLAPTQNLEVQLSFPNEPATADEYYTSLPSPQLTGLPTDNASQQLLTDYYLLRAAVSLTNAAKRPELIVDAVSALRLESVDPGFASRFSGTNVIILPFATPTPLVEEALGLSTAVPYPPPATSFSTRAHTVQSGETLTSIAALYNVSVETLVQLNNLTDPNQLSVGQVLLIPQNGN